MGNDIDHRNTQQHKHGVTYLGKWSRRQRKGIKPLCKLPKHHSRRRRRCRDPYGFSPLGRSKRDWNA